MTTERERDIVAAYADGTDVRTIGQLYGLPATEVERIVAGCPAEPPPSRWSLRHRGNRAALGFGVGFVAQVVAGLGGAGFGARLLVWAVAAGLVYALAGTLSKR